MATTKIYAPNESYTGKIAGIPFAGGVGELDSEKLGKDRTTHLKEWFGRKGYGVGKKANAEDAEVQNLKGSEKPLEQMSNEELDEVGKGKGVVGISSMNKPEKIEAIKDATKDDDSK